MIELQTNGLERAIQRLSLFPNGLKKAQSRAINRTLRVARAFEAKKIKEQYTIKPKDFKSTLAIKSSGTVGELLSKGKRSPLEKFKHSPKKVVRPQPAGGILAEVRRGQSFRGADAWVARMEKIYERIGKKRVPFRRLYGPSAPEMLNLPTVAQAIENRMKERFEVDLLHEVNFLLS